MSKFTEENFPVMNKIIAEANGDQSMIKESILGLSEKTRKDLRRKFRELTEQSMEYLNL